MQLTITEMKKMPNMYKNVVDATMGAKSATLQKQVFDGKSGYTEGGGQKAALAGDDLDDIMESADIAYDIHSDKYGIKRTVKGIEKVNGSDAYVLETVNSKGKKATDYYDVATGYMVKKIQGEGEKQSITEFSDYKEVPGTGGYKMAYKVVQTQSGQTFPATVESVEVNKGIAETEFK